MRRIWNLCASARGTTVRLTAATLLTLMTACHAHAGTPPGAPPMDAPQRAHALERPPPPLLPDRPPVQPVTDTLTTRVCGDDPRVAACAVHRPRASPHLLGMAVRGRTIAVAWVTAGNSWLPAPSTYPAAGAARIAWFDADLRLRGEQDLEVASASDIDLAATADGWVVAVQTTKGVELLRLADDGTRAAPTEVLAGAALPGITTTPAGDVLVVHTGVHAGRHAQLATLVDRRGRAAWTTEVFAGTIEPNFGGQVYTDGGGFLVGRRDNAGVSVARVEQDGTVSARRVVGGSTEYPSLVWCGGEGRVVWTDFGRMKIRSTALDRRGDVIGPEQVLGGTPEYFNHSPAVCDGAGALVLLGGYTGGTGVSNRLDLTHVDRERGALPGAIRVLAEGDHAAYDPRLARLDDRRVAVAWVSLGPARTRAQIGLAVVDAARAQEARLPLVVEPR